MAAVHREAEVCLGSKPGHFFAITNCMSKLCTFKYQIEDQPPPSVWVPLPFLTSPHLWRHIQVCLDLDYWWHIPTLNQKLPVECLQRATVTESRMSTSCLELKSSLWHVDVCVKFSNWLLLSDLSVPLCKWEEQCSTDGITVIKWNNMCTCMRVRVKCRIGAWYMLALFFPSLEWVNFTSIYCPGCTDMGNVRSAEAEVAGRSHASSWAHG